MKNHELYIMRDGLNAVPDNVSYQDKKKKGIVKFKFAGSKNKRMLSNHLKDMEKAIEASKELIKYQEKEQELSKKFCRKDKDGKNIFLPFEDERLKRFDINGFDDPASAYSTELKSLKKSFKSAIEEQEKKMEDFNDFLKDESDFEPYLIPLDLVPEDLPQSAMDGILFMIKDEEPEKSTKKRNKS